MSKKTAAAKAKPKTAKKPTPRKAEPTTPILEWKDLDVRKKTLFEQHAFRAKTQSGTYCISPGRDGGHDVIFFKPRQGHSWEDHATTLEQAKELARAHAAKELEPDAKPALLTAAQVKASADEPSERGTPIGELHYLGREIRGRTERLDVLGGKTVNMKDSIDRLLAEAAKLCDRKGFEAFKEHYCPEFSESWTYQLLAVQEGRKTLEELRAATRLRVAKHRAGKRDVTESNSVTPDEGEQKPPVIRLNGGQKVDIEDLGPKAQAQLAEKLARSAADEHRQRRLAEEQWQCSLTNIAGDAVSLRAFWKKTFGDWEKFEVPADLLDLAKQAALAWTQLANDLAAKDVGLRPATPSPEERKAEIERGEQGTFLTDAEFEDLSPAAQAQIKAATDDPLFVIYDDGDYIAATPWFASKIKPIFDGSIKNDEAKSALALMQYKRACAEFLPQLTFEDMESAWDIWSVISDMKNDVDGVVDPEAELVSNVVHRDIVYKATKRWNEKHPEQPKTQADIREERGLVPVKTPPKERWFIALNPTDKKKLAAHLKATT